MMAITCLAPSYVGMTKTAPAMRRQLPVRKSEKASSSVRFRIRKGFMCEIGTDLQEKVAARASSVSALEQLKAAHKDRKLYSQFWNLGRKLDFFWMLYDEVKLKESLYGKLWF